jgi:hypothetical protein
MSGALRRFGELGKAGNKQWTLFARITSGSWLWRFQARLRALMNAVEILTDAQAKENVELLNSIKTRADLAEALDDSLIGYRKAETALRKLREGEWSEDYIKGLKDIKNDTVITAMIAEYGDLEKALEKTSKMYKNLNENAKRAEDMNKKGFFKFYKEKIVEGFMKETSLKGIQKRLGNANRMLNPFGKMKDTGEVGITGKPIMQPTLNKNSIFFKAASFIYNGLKMLPKALGMFMRALLTFSLYGMLVIFGLLLIVPIIKKLPAAFKYIEEKTGAFGIVFELIKTFLFLILNGVMRLGQAIWDGRFVDAFKIFFGEIVAGIFALGVTILAGIVLALTSLVAALVGAVVKSFRNFIGFSKGGVSQGNINLVGERGPELVRLPAGSRVIPNNQSRSMGGNTINVHVNGRVGASDAEIRDIANKVAREINIRMNRQGTTTMGG